MAAGLSFKIKGDSTGFVSSVKSAEKSIGSLADKVRGVGLGKLSEQLRRASTSLKSFSSPKVEVDPIIKSVGKLNDKLKGLSKDKNKVNLQLDAYQAVGDLKKLQEQLKGVLSQRGKVELDANGQQLEKKLIRFKAKLAELQKAESASIVLDADGRKLNNKIDRLKSKLAQMHERNPGVPLDADGKKLEAKIRSFQEKLNLLKKSAPKPVIDIDVTKLKSKIKGLDSRLAKLKSSSPKIPLDADAQKLVAKIKAAKEKLRGLESQVNLRLNSKQVREKITFIKSFLKKISNQKTEVKVDLKLKQAGFDRAKKKLQKALTMRGVAKIPGLKGWQKALLMAGVTAYKVAATVSGPLSKGLMLAAHASNKLSVAGNKLNKTLAVVAVVGVKSLKLGLRGIVGAAKLATMALKKLAAAGRKLVGIGFSKLKSLAFTGIKLGAIAATAAVTGLIVALKKSIEVAASLEQLQVQFTSITGSPDDALDMVKHLREESKRTGVEIGAMAVMMRRLLASGMDVTEAKKMTASLLDISGALGLTSEESKLLGVALSQVKAKGIASMEELRQQISEKGVEIFKVLEQKLGKKGKDLFDMIAAGAVGADVVVDAFMNLEGPLARFRGGSDRMAASFTGSLRRMKAQIIDTFAVFGQPFLAGLSSAMDAVREKVKQLEPAIKKITDRAGSVVGVLVEAFRGGKLGEMIKLSLIVGGKAMVSTVVAGLKAGFVGASIILKNAFTKILDINFWKGVSDILSSTFKMLQVAMMEVAMMFNPFGKKEKQKRMYTLQAQATQEDIRGMNRINDSGNGKPVDDILIEAGQAMAKIIKDSINDPAMDGTKEQMLLNKLYDSFLADAKKREEERQARMFKIAPPEEITPVESKEDKMVEFYKPIVTSMQRIGGASIKGLGAASLAIRRNSLLERIAQSTGDTLALHKQNQEKPDNKDVAVGGTLSSVITSLVIKAIPKPSKQADKAGGSLASVVTGEIMKVIGANGVAEVDPDKYQSGQKIMGRLTEASKIGVSGVGTAITDSMKKMMPNQNNAAVNNDPFLKLDEQRNVLLKSIDKQIGKIGGPAVFA